MTLFANFLPVGLKNFEESCASSSRTLLVFYGRLWDALKLRVLCWLDADMLRYLLSMLRFDTPLASFTWIPLISFGNF